MGQTIDTLQVRSDLESASQPWPVTGGDGAKSKLESSDDGIEAILFLDRNRGSFDSWRALQAEGPDIRPLFSGRNLIDAVDGILNMGVRCLSNKFSALPTRSNTPG